MSNATAFGTPVTTMGLPGFPDSLRDVGEARACIEAARLPAIRSQPAWVEAYKRLTLAQATGLPHHVAAARKAVVLAAVGEQCFRATVFRPAALARAA